MTEPAESRPWSTIELRLAALIVLLAAALWAPRLRGPLDLRYDAGVYYILGRSLAEGHGYRLLNEPGAIEAIQYPPVLPAVAALHQLALGTSDPVVVGHALRLTMALLFLGYALASFALARRYLSPGFAFAAALLAILNAQVVFLSDYFAADLPYTAVSLFFFVAPAGFAAGALAVTAFGLRTAGVALLAAWAAQSLVQRRWGEAAGSSRGGGPRGRELAGVRPPGASRARSTRGRRTPISGQPTSSTTSAMSRTCRTWTRSDPSSAWSGGGSSRRASGRIWRR